jgi:hypothetical protein
MDSLPHAAYGAISGSGPEKAFAFAVMAVRAPLRAREERELSAFSVQLSARKRSALELTAER